MGTRLSLFPLRVLGNAGRRVGPWHKDEVPWTLLWTGRYICCAWLLEGTRSSELATQGTERQLGEPRNDVSSPSGLSADLAIDAGCIPESA